MKFGKLRTLRGQIEVTGGGVARKNLVAADGLNESQDPFKRISELALKSYGTCKYED